MNQVKDLQSNQQNILVFDTETTGANRFSDQIIEICIQEGIGDNASITTRRIKPSIPIKREATLVHGITDEDLKDCPGFAEIAEEIIEKFNRADVVIGYNVNFDIEILQAELIRAKLPPVQFKEKKIIDPLMIWRHYDRRNLSSAYTRFVGGELKNAHSAQADVEATAAVFQGMVDVFKLQEMPIEELARLTYPREWVGFSAHIQWSGKTPVFSFGKFNKKQVWDAVQSDKSYAAWIATAAFPDHVVEICNKAATATNEEFLQFIYQLYGEPDV